MTVPPGWYPDPAEPTTRKYWDGEQWTPDPTDHRPVSPARTPGAAGGEPVEVSRVALAGPATRLAARLVDIAVLLVLNAAVNGYFLVQYIDEMMPVLTKATREYQSGGGLAMVELTARAERLSITITAVALALWLAYEVPSLINSGQTLGKRLLGIRVVTVGAQPARLGHALRRWGVTALPLLFPLACGLPFVLLESAWCLWDRPRRQAIHDKLGQTIVVDDAMTSSAKT